MDNDSDMENAINELDTANPPSLRNVALKWGVKRSTLSDHMKGAKTRRKAQARLQLLTPTQVSALKRFKPSAASGNQFLLGHALNALIALKQFWGTHISSYYH
jgi:hypothetical protein